MTPFADDATIHTPDTSLETLNGCLQQGLSEISCWCENNAIIINPSKTEYMTIATRQKHQLKSLTLSLEIQDHTISQATKHRLHGDIVDNHMK